MSEEVPELTDQDDEQGPVRPSLAARRAIPLSERATPRHETERSGLGALLAAVSKVHTSSGGFRSLPDQEVTTEPTGTPAQLRQRASRGSARTAIDRLRAGLPSNEGET